MGNHQGFLKACAAPFPGPDIVFAMLRLFALPGKACYTEIALKV